MSVRLSDDQHVALYDSVSGRAFGPTFDSLEHANDFLAWWNRRPTVIDLRLVSPRTLDARWKRWQRERLDENGELFDG